MIARIFSKDPDAIMPPPDSHKVLTNAQKEILKKWIEQGAEYEPHWAFIKPVKWPQPVVKQKNWVQNPIDAFVLAKLEKKGLMPAPKADLKTLARRISLDIRGIPPTVDELNNLLNDKSPAALETYVDLMLSSPRWGEHRARYWLDLARYADTHGIHFDNLREMWSYREWVIHAFNKNMPYDQFTIEQLAGDLLPEPTMEQKIASGFHRCNITTNEGGIIDEEYKVLYARDRTETTAQVWMGLTAGCAVCHDHKYDPISTKEFYSMSAFFNNTTQPVRDGNRKDTPPIIRVPKPEDVERYKLLPGEIAKFTNEMNQRKKSNEPEFVAWFNKMHKEAGDDNKNQLALPTQNLHALLPMTDISVKKETKVPSLTYTLNGESKELEVKGLLSKPGLLGGTALLVSEKYDLAIADIGDFEKDQSFSFGAWIKLDGKSSNGALFSRMDVGNNFRGWDLWLQNKQVGTHIISKWDSDALKVVSKSQIPDNKWTHVFVTYDGSSKQQGVKIYINGKLDKHNVERDSLKGTIRTKVPFHVGQRHQGSHPLGALIQGVRIYQRNISGAEVKQLASGSHMESLIKKELADLKPAEKNQLKNWWTETQDKTYIGLVTTVGKLQQEKNAIEARGTIAHIMTERKEMAEAYILNRGEYDQRLDKVTPATFAILPNFPETLPKNRLGLAKWLVRNDQPLTSRVAVNQFWQQIFGTGIVKTAGDFGTTGMPPSHLELLDWLAVDFQESGWDSSKGATDRDVVSLIDPAWRGGWLEMRASFVISKTVSGSHFTAR